MTEVRVTLQVCLQRITVAFSGFAEEPADSFVDKVVPVVEEYVGNGECVGKLPVPDEGHGGHYADALFPKGLSVFCQPVEEAAVFLREQPFSQKGVAAQVDEVPVVDAVGVGEVEVNATGAESFVRTAGLGAESFVRTAGAVASRGRTTLRLTGMGEDFHQREERGQADFVILAANATLEFREGVGGLAIRRQQQVAPASAYNLPCYGDLDSEELIPFPVLPRAAFEEPAEARHLRRIRRRQHLIVESVHRSHSINMRSSGIRRGHRLCP